MLAREGLLFAPPAFAGLSLFYVGAKVLFGFRQSNTSAVNGKTNGMHHTNGLDSDGSTKAQSLAETIQDLDGWSIIFFRTSRLLAVLALLSLQVFELSAKGSSTVRNLEFVFYVSELNEFRNTFVKHNYCISDIHIRPCHLHDHIKPEMERRRLPSACIPSADRLCRILDLGCLAICNNLPASLRPGV